MLKLRATPVEFAPETFADDLTCWIDAGKPPRSELLGAILANDLGHVIALAPGPSGWALVHATKLWLWKYAPSGSYGSKTAVAVWEQMGGRGGLQ